MYDGHIYCEDYDQFKDLLSDIINDDVDDYDIDTIERNIYELYDSGQMSAAQYDDLMAYVEEIKDEISCEEF